MATLTTDLSAARRQLDEQGFCLLEGALGAGRLAEVRGRLVEQAAREVQEGWANAYHHDSQAVLNLLNKGPVFAEVATHRPVLDLVEHLLGEEVLLSSLTANIVGPGCPAQALHADQVIVPTPWPYAMVANVAWMLDDFTEANGATLVVPGSHHRNTNPNTYRGAMPETVAVEAPAGSAMVFDGRLWHAAGSNVTDRRRHALFAYYCKPFLRQQENMFLSLDRDVVEGASPQLRRLLGYVPWFGKVGIIPR